MTFTRPEYSNRLSKNARGVYEMLTLFVQIDELLKLPPDSTRRSADIISMINKSSNANGLESGLISAERMISSREKLSQYRDAVDFVIGYMASVRKRVSKESYIASLRAMVHPKHKITLTELEDINFIAYKFGYARLACAV